MQRFHDGVVVAAVPAAAPLCATTMRLAPPVRRIIAVVGSMLALGCATWRTVPIAPEPAPAERRLGSVRVTPTDDTLVVWEDAVLTADSVVGLVRGRAGAGAARAAVAREDVRRIEVRERRWFGGRGLLGTVGVLGALVLAALAVNAL